jgi:hypothetical protein
MNATQRKATTLVQGYVIQGWALNARSWDRPIVEVKCYSVKGALPAEWEATKQDGTIGKARIYRTTQVLKRADKRINVDSFTR